MKRTILFNCLIALAALNAAPLFGAKRVDCTSDSNKGYTLVQVPTSATAWPGDTEDFEQVVEKPMATTLTITTGSGKCGSVEGGSGADSDYPTSSAYRMRSNIHSAKLIAARLLTLYMKDSNPDVGTAYTNVAKLGTTTCTETVNGTQVYFWKQCVAP